MRSRARWLAAGRRSMLRKSHEPVFVFGKRPGEIGAKITRRSLSPFASADDNAVKVDPAVKPSFFGRV